MKGVLRGVSSLPASRGCRGGKNLASNANGTPHSTELRKLKMMMESKPEMELTIGDRKRIAGRSDRSREGLRGISTDGLLQ
jgi:hypothetical protein